MKLATFSTSLIAILLAACASPTTKPQLVYGLGDDELNQLGELFGYRVEAMGLDDYSFTRGKRVFHVFAHNHLPVHRRLQAEGPVILRDWTPGRKEPIETQISIEQGVAFAVVEQHFANFIQKMETSKP